MFLVIYTTTRRGAIKFSAPTPESAAFDHECRAHSSMRATKGRRSLETAQGPGLHRRAFIDSRRQSVQSRRAVRGQTLIVSERLFEFLAIWIRSGARHRRKSSRHGDDGKATRDHQN